MSKTVDRCRLYLLLPAILTARMARDLEEAMQAADIACFLFPAAGDPSAEAQALQLMQSAQANGVAVLIQDDAAKAKALDADGVHLQADLAAYQAARALLGNGAIVGVGCGFSRHDAMTLAEKGADYVAFGAEGCEARVRAELIAWWAEIFEVPCVAWAVESIEDAASLARAGADFVALSVSLWQSERPLDLIRGADAALARARSTA